MSSKTKTYLGVTLAVLILALWIGQSRMEASTSAAVELPRFEVDPFWPKPLDNHWVIGSVGGIWVDEDDVVWVVHRASSLSATELGLDQDPPIADCCSAAPEVLAFDQEGNLVHSWGGTGEGYDWPQSPHGIFVDHLGQVWIGGNGPGDSQILKFTKDGEFLAQYGVANARYESPDPEPTDRRTRNSHDTRSFGSPADIYVDPGTNEVYIADGYFNRRVAVVDPESAEVTRYWGAYGNAPDDDYEFAPPGANTPPAQQFGSPVHCVIFSNDDLVYVCDRQNNRIQVFRPDGSFIEEGFVERGTLASGAVWDIAFSNDPDQRYIYLADGQNMKVHILLRESLEVVGSFGDGGRQPGQFYGTHVIASDSEGNIYTGETYEGKRVQKFVNTGNAEIPGDGSYMPWPD